MAGRLNAFAYWSLYVSTPSERLLRETHLPPISAALENIEFDWDISTERENPGLFRLVTHQNFEAETVEDIVVPVLRRAYRMSDTWKIKGLDALSSGELKHVQGDCDVREPQTKPPALVSMVFEIEVGHIRPRAGGGGWQVASTGNRPIGKRAR